MRKRRALAQGKGRRRNIPALQPTIQVAIATALQSEVSPATSVPEPPVEPSPIPDRAPVVPSDQPSLRLPAPQNQEPLQARMLNEYVYCPRLFYYEHVEGVFLNNADTLRGNALHKKVDSGDGAMPGLAKAGGETEGGTEEQATIHSRSVQMGSERLNVVAKMDLVESRTDSEDLLQAFTVCPVDYKAGAPREGSDGNELWDTDKMQLGLQVLILRDNGYACRGGIIYYRATKQRVSFEVTPEIEEWICRTIEKARQCMEGAIPPPLDHSPKCVRCSLAPVCLPDETLLLRERPEVKLDDDSPETTKPSRRLIAARDDRRPLYLNTQGNRVGCKSEVLEVKEKDKLVQEVRTRDLSHVALFGNIQISTQAIQELCHQEIPVTYFSSGGYFYGITRGHELKNVFLRMEQFRLARDPVYRLHLARRFVFGKIRNHRTLLRRNHLEPPVPVILKLRRAAQDALHAVSIESLLGIEGSAASLYFGEFNGMIKADDTLSNMAVAQDGKGASQLNFNFTQRNRRPPTDPVNAMLSMAYSLLSKDCTLAAVAVGFDPYVGYYHQPRFGRPALALDLMEEFRPLVAESTVLTCINNRIITEKDFVRAGKAVNLSPAGRKRFFSAYEQRMGSVVTHPLFDYKVTYRRALELQARILAKTLTSEVPDYIPFLTR